MNGRSRLRFEIISFLAWTGLLSTFCLDPRVGLAQSGATADVIDLLKEAISCPLPCKDCDFFRPTFGDTYGIFTQSIVSDGRSFELTRKREFKELNEATRKLEPKVSQFRYTGTFSDILTGQPKLEDVGDRFTELSLFAIPLACSRKGCLKREQVAAVYPDREGPVTDKLTINFCTSEAAQNAKVALDELLRLNTDASISSQGPSFDCIKSSSLDEKTICSVPALGVLDRQLAEAYRRAISRETDTKRRSSLMSSQKRWWSVTRRECLSDPACIAAEYLERIDALSQ